MRLGGLYALERLAQDNPAHRQTVVNVLCAYLRMPYRVPGPPPTDDEDQRRHDEHRERTQEREVRVAAQRILTHHLAPQDADRFWDGMALDLTGAHLVDFDFESCRVGPARFERATFVGLARFTKAVFTGPARFDHATFTGAAHFDGATFGDAASFEGATGLHGDLPMDSDIDLAELLGLGDPYAFDPADTWKPRSGRKRLRVEIGVQAAGGPIELDLKESTQGGMGPHGLLMGATSSGKSELLRTLVLALAVTHPPGSLNFVLIDFKGGATFTRLDSLPHTSAVITNVVDQLPLVGRMTDSLKGELLRRRELLRDAGDYASILDYERARATGAPLPEIPTLLVICDEFSELVSVEPEVIDTFVLIGRVGRPLGIHLLLASRRLEGERLRGLESHLSYRIALRASSEVDSRAALGTPDAFRLPRAPGHGFLRVGAEPMERFRAAYVSSVHRQDDAKSATGNDDAALGETLLDILVDRMHGRGTPARQVWLPPLNHPEPLSALLPPLTTDPERGFSVAADSGLRGGLRAVVGVVDRPLEQRQDPLVLDLSGDAGHVAVVGGPRSGRTTLLRTMIAGLALTHTPRQAQFYCLDFGGGLGVLRGLPHVGGVADRRDGSAVRRTVADVTQVLNDRRARFLEHGVDGMADYRRARADGRFGDDPYGDVFLVVDGWSTLRREHDDVEGMITELVARGLDHGVHVVVTCTHWLDLRSTLRDRFGTKVELRLDDPETSLFAPKAAANVPTGTPGRGITDTGHHFLAALPRIDGGSQVHDLDAATARLVDRIATDWAVDRGAPPVRRLPAVVEFGALPRGEADALSIGISETDLAPVPLRPATDPHFLVFGGTGSGKTNVLRVVAQRIAEAYPPEQARLAVVNYRRGLLDAVPPGHLVGYGTNPTITATVIDEVVRTMTQRLPGAEVTADRLRDRSWWRGPDLYLLVDDYDVVAGWSANPLAALLELLPQAHDIGLHVILAGRSDDGGRAGSDPVVQRLRGMGTPELVLSGDRDGPSPGAARPPVHPAGRGWLDDRRGGRRLVQLAWLPADEPPTTSERDPHPR
ncbi:ESX secretion system protein EccC [Actinosynnema sp. ALI-1.44]